MKVIIPEQKLTGFQFTQDGFTGMANINEGLIAFKAKKVFAWHLSIMVDLKDVDTASLPTIAENTVLEHFEKQLNAIAVGENTEQPNALFLGRIAWNSTMELLWKVYDPELPHKALQALLQNAVRPFDYRIDPDKKWELSKWHLDAIQSL